MENRIDDIVKRCSAPFARDAELKTEIENEVNDHLASAAAEVGEEEAVRRFGDPEPVAQELLLSNFNRLKWRSRFKLAVKILIVPAVLASVFFCVSRDTIGGNLLLLTDFLGNSDRPHAQRIKVFNLSLLMAGRPQLDDRQYRVLMNIPAPLGELKPELDKNPDPVNRARYIMALIANKDVAPGVVEDELSAAVAAEPDNAFYDLLLSERLCRRAVAMEINPNVKDPFYVVKDRKLLDRAMACYLSGIKKPYFRTYLAEIYAPGMAMVPDDGTLTGWSLRMASVANWLLPHLSSMREVARMAEYYTEILVAENDPRAEEFLNGWKRQSLLMVESDDPTLIMQLVATFVAKSKFPKLADALRKRGDEKAAAELARQSEEVRRLNYAGWPGSSSEVRRENQRMVKDYGGVISAMLISSIGDGMTRENLWPERKYTMTVFNNLTLLVLEILVVVLMAMLAMVFAFWHRGAYLMLLPGRTYLKLVVFGAALPLAAWMIFSYALYRSPINCLTALLWSAVPAAICLIWFAVLAVFTLTRRYRKLNAIRIPFPLLTGNLIVLLAGFIALNTVFMRPGLDFMRARAISEDRMVFRGEFFTPTEDRATAMLRDGQIKILKEIIKQPIRLEQTGK